MAAAAALIGLVSGCGSSRKSSQSTATLSGPRTIFVYEARGGGHTVTPAAIEATIVIMRKRANDIGAANVIRQSGADRITVELAASSTPREPVVAKSAQLLFYDWEPNVIGADGKPAPSEAIVTGGQ
jgi:preprotein translocase subunit SecD